MDREENLWSQPDPRGIFALYPGKIFQCKEERSAVINDQFLRSCVGGFF